MDYHSTPLLKYLSDNKDILEFYLKHALYGLFYFKKDNFPKVLVDRKLQSFLGLKPNHIHCNLLQYLNISSQRFLKELLEQKFSNNHKFSLKWESNRIIYSTKCNTYFGDNMVFIGLSELEQQHEINNDLILEKKRLDNIIEGVKLGTWEYNIKEESLKVNKNWAKIIGYQLEEITPVSSETWRSRVHPEDLPRVEEAISNYINNKNEIYDVEFRMQHKRKSWVWIESRGTVLTRDTYNNPILFSGTHYDISKRKKREEELRLYERIIKNTNDAIIISELNYNNVLDSLIVFVNEALSKFISYDIHHFLTKTLKTLFDGLTDKATLNRIEGATKQLQPFNCELITYNKDGRSIWVHLLITPIKDKKNNHTHLISILRDITAQKEQKIELRKAKEKIEESEKKYRQLVENSNDIIYTLSFKGVLNFVSPAWERLLGYTKEETEGHSFKKFVHPDDVHLCSNFLEKVITTGKSLEGIEYRVKHKDGRWFWHTSSGVPRKDINGKVIGYDGFARDITEKKYFTKQLIEAKTRAEESENRLKLATHSAQIGVWEWDINNNNFIWDEKTYKIFGFKKHELQNPIELWPNTLHPDDKEKAFEEIITILKEKNEFTSSYRIKHHNNKVKYIHTYGSVFRNKIGRAVRMVGITRDVTNEKVKELELKESKEKAEAASLAKSDFLANMSHEIRTPLNSVIGFSELLMQTQLDNIQKDYMQSVNFSANTLLDLINDILDFSKIEAGKLELQLERTDLHTMLYQIVEMIKFKLSEREIELLLHIASDVPQFVFADAVRIRQILVNLMGNAAKFTESGEIELFILKLEKRRDDKKITLRFGVKDTGIGISEMKQKNIFEAFSQEDASITRKYGGTGLGLSISNKLLDLMGSTLQLTSKQGKGSSFYFDVDLEYEEEPYTEENTFDDINTILLVDDNARNLEIIENFFVGSDIKVERANNGIEALTKVQSNWQTYDAMLIDIKMPFLDGTEVVKQIKEKLYLNEQQLPIFMMCDSLNEDICTQLKENYPIVGFIHKPVLKKDLLAQLSLTQNVENESSELIKNTAVQPQTSSFDGRSLLIVDDNPVNRKLARSMVSKLYNDIKIFEAENGTTAIEMVKNNSFSLIFMDIQMPDMSGYETTRRIRNLEDIKNRPTIIALTAGTVKGERERCLAAGMDDYLSKPVTLDKLKSMIKKWTDSGEIEDDINITQVSNKPNRLDFNYKAFLRQLENDEVTLEEILTLIREGSLKTQITELNEVFGQLYKQEETQLITHRIRGLCKSIYAENLADKLGQLENMYPNYDSEEAKILLEQINEAHQIVENIISEKAYKTSK